jgi:methyl-accepting chemotaxis protein
MQKLLAMAILPAAITGMLIAGLSTDTLETNITSEVEEVLHATALGLSESIDISDLDNYQHLLNMYKTELQIDTTIFIGDLRKLTTVEGSINTSADPMIYSHVMQDQHYFSTNANVNGVEYFGYYIPLHDDTDKIIGMTFAGKPTATMNQAIKFNVIKIASAVTVILTIVIFIIVLLAKHIVKRLKAATDIVKEVANGNLTIDTNIKLSNDEIGDVGRDVIFLVEKLRDSIYQISNSSDALHKLSGDLTNISKVSSEAAAEITQAVTDIAKGAENQANDTQNGANHMSNVDELIIDISEQTKSLVEIGEVMRNIEGDVMHRIDSSIKLNDLTNTELIAVNDSIERTSKSIDNIVKAMKNINDITDQVQLLSLNASIEAAHAGEAGKGFAVVATNVGDLAKASKDTSSAIEAILSELLTDYESMKKSIEKLIVNITNQSANIESTSKQFDILDKNISDVIEHISDTEKGINEIERLADSVVEILSDLSAISEENAAVTEETTAGTEGLNENIMKVSNDAIKLNDISGELIRAVEYFKM